MRILEATKERATVELSAEDVRLLGNALNEVCNGIDLPEFETRVGFSRAEVANALRGFRRLRERMPLS